MRDRAEEALRPLVRELLLVDHDLLAAEARRGAHGNLADLVDSGAELLFRPGTVAYDGACRVETGPDGGSLVVLSVRFAHDGVDAAYALTLGEGHGRAVLQAFSVDDGADGAPTGQEPALERLVATLKRASVGRDGTDAVH